MVANVLGYVLYALLSRVLGVEAYGTLSSLFAILVIVSAPALIAQTVAAKLASDLVADPSRLAGLARTIESIAVRVALATAGALAALAVPLASFLHIDDPLLVVLTALSLCGAIVLPFLRGILQGTSSFRAFALSNVAENLGKVVFAPVLGSVAGLRGALAGVALGYLAAAAYTFVAARPHRPGASVALAVRGLVSSVAGVALAVLCINVLLFYDVVLAKRYLDAHSAGLYSAAALACRAVYAVIVFIPTVLLPQTADRSARGERTRWLFVQALALTVAICLCAVALYVLVPGWVITTITGRAFLAGAPFLAPYVVAIAALATTNVIATYNIARGRFRFVAPLVLVVLGEIAAVVIRHRSAADLLQTIAVGHALALLACASSLGGPPAAPAQGRCASKQRERVTDGDCLQQIGRAAVADHDGRDLAQDDEHERSDEAEPSAGDVVRRDHVRGGEGGDRHDIGREKRRAGEECATGDRRDHPAGHEHVQRYGAETDRDGERERLDEQPSRSLAARRAIGGLRQQHGRDEDDNRVHRSASEGCGAVQPRGVRVEIALRQHDVVEEQDVDAQHRERNAGDARDEAAHGKRDGGALPMRPSGDERICRCGEIAERDAGKRAAQTRDRTEHRREDDLAEVLRDVRERERAERRGTLEDAA